VLYILPCLKQHPLRGLFYFVIYRHDNTQEARQVGILGVERRALPQVQLTGYFFIHRHDNNQEARQVGILGASPCMNGPQMPKKNFAVDDTERTLPANAGTASSASPGQAQLRVSMQSLLRANKRLTEYLRKQENSRKGGRGR
jgi:hypothetical protein